MAYFGSLAIENIHFLVFITWYLSHLRSCELVYPVYLTYTSRWACLTDNDTIATAHFDRDCAVYERCPNDSLVYEEPAFHSASDEWGMRCGQSAWYMALVSTVQFAGISIGTLVWSHIGDRYGRRPTGIAATVLSTVVIAATGWCQNWRQLIVVRWFVGFAVACGLTVTYAHTIELLRPQQRMVKRGFVNWGLARLLMTLWSFIWPYWRIASHIMALFTISLLLMLIFVLPESPVWLSTQPDKVKELEKALDWIKRINGTADQQDGEENEQENGTKPDEQSSAQMLSPVVVVNEEEEDDETSTSDSPTYSTLDLFTTPWLRCRTFVFMMMWFTTSMSSYAVDLNAGRLSGNFYLNQFWFGFTVAMARWCLFFVDARYPWFNRKVLHHGSMSIVVVFMAIVLGLLWIGDDESKMLITYLNIASIVFIEYTWDANYLTAAEGYPTVVRSIGVGTCSFCARIGMVVAPQVAHLSVVWPPAMFVIIIVWCSACLIMCILWMPETKNIELPMTLERDETAVTCLGGVETVETLVGKVDGEQGEQQKGREMDQLNIVVGDNQSADF